MRIVRKRVLAVLLSIVAAAMMLVALSTTAYAGTDQVTIDVTLNTGDIGNGLSNVDNSADVATDSQWYYVAATKQLYLDTVSGDYILTGNNSGIQILVNAANMQVTLDNLHVTASSVGQVGLGILEDCTITLVGPSSVTGNVNSGFGMDIGNSCTISGDGIFRAVGGGSGEKGIHTFGTLIISGNASVTAIGGSGARAVDINAGGAIKMGDGATFILTNNHMTEPDVLTIGAYDSTPSNSRWQLSGDASAVAGYETTDPLSVTVAFSKSGTIQRIFAVCANTNTGKFYALLEDAVAVVGDTHKLLLMEDIDEDFTLVVGGAPNFGFTIDMDGYSIALNTGGIEVGGLNNNLKILNGTLLSADYLYTHSGSALTVVADEVSLIHGIVAVGVSGIFITGDVTTGDDGIYAVDSGTYVSIEGNLDAGGDGIEAYDGSIVVVTGNLTAALDAIRAEDTGTIVGVLGNVMAGEWFNANDGAEVLVGGNVTLSGDYSCVWSRNGYIEIDGNVVVSNLIGNSFYAVFSMGPDSVIKIGGNVTSNKNGVWANDGGEITIDGTLTIGTDMIYITLEVTSPDPDPSTYLDLAAADFTKPTTKEGYLTYTDSLSNVWIWDPTSTVPGTGDSIALLLLFGALMAAALGTGAVFVHRRRQQQD